MIIDPFMIFGAVRKGLNDPNRFVSQEIEKRRPHWRRERIMLIGGWFLISLVLLITTLNGWNL